MRKPMLDRAPKSAAPPVRNALRTVRFSRLAGFIVKPLAFYDGLIGQDRCDDFRLQRVAGVPILVTASVFSAKVRCTATFLAPHLDERRVDAEVFVEELRQGGFAISVLAERRLVNERPAILRLSPASPRSAV